MTDRAALLIGVSRCGWGSFPELRAPCQDVVALKKALAKNQDETPNLKCEIRSNDATYGGIGRDNVSEAIDRYLSQDHDLFIIYFAGHAVTADKGGVAGLVTGTGHSMNLIAFRDLLERLDRARKIRNTVIFLDCCHAGAIMQLADRPLPAGVALFAATAENQQAIEKENQGVFTKVMIAGLEGAAAGRDGRVSVLSLYEYLDREMTEAGQRPIFATHLQRNITLRLCDPEPPHETEPLSPRTAKSLRSFFDKGTETTCIDVVNDATAEVALFADICGKAWKETGTADVLKQALGNDEFGGYLHARARLKGQKPDEMRYLTWSLQDHPNFTRLQRLLGDETPDAQEAKRKDDHVSHFKDELLAHWILKGIFSPVPIAFGIDFSTDEWCATVCEPYDQKLAVLISLSSSENYQIVLRQLARKMFRPDFEPRLRSLRRMKDPNDKEAYASYMGTRIKSSLIVPAQGEPGLALALVFEKRLLIASRDVPDGNGDYIQLNIDELMAIILATERLKEVIGRQYRIRKTDG